MHVRQTFRFAASIAATASLIALGLVLIGLFWRVGESGGQVRDTGLLWLLAQVLHTMPGGSEGPVADALHRYYSFDAQQGWWSFLAAALAANMLATCAGLLPLAALISWVRGRREYPRQTPVIRHASLIALLLAVVSLGWTAARGSGMASGSPASHPNVLLVSIDTLRADHLSAYGYERETSPNIDALAAGGALFTQAISPSSWTLPTHATMLTGIPLPHHGVNSDEDRLSASVVTLAEVLAEAGYRTAAFVSAPYLHPRYGFDQGFDLYDNSAEVHDDARNLVTSPALEKLTVDWLNRWIHTGGEQPFFIFLHMWDPHWNYIPPSPFDTMFDPDYDGDLDGSNFLERIGPTRDSKLSARDLEHLLALYDGEIRFTDHHLGRIIARIEEWGQLDNTIILVTADHGEEFFDHGRVGHAMTLYDESVQIPLIIHYPPKVPPGTVVNEQVRTRDVPATLLSLAGISVPDYFGLPADTPEFRAMDLSPWIEGRPRLPKLPAYGDLRGNIHSLRTETRKFIYEGAFDYPQYFDLTTDPEEQNNLARRGSKRVKTLRQSLRLFAEAEVGPRPAERTEPDRKHLERLRSLGYIN